jgi:ABC-type transport system substrate-binding protein
MSIYSEIKKYLLFLVGFFCLLLAAHIIFLYIYHDAEKYPLPGGTINIGMMGEKPVLNALNFDTKIENDPNDTVLRFIYRSLVRFSPAEKKIVNDLASCDVENFPTVRCTLNQNALWNDGVAMTPEDVLATYAFFREKSTNEYTKSQLGLVEVSENT